MAKMILTIDDAASVRQMVSFVLKQSGYDVIEAVDGRDALQCQAPGIFSSVCAKFIFQFSDQLASC